MNILNKLTLKHLKLNKRRTIVTIIGIILSTSLMVGIGLLLSTMRENMIDMVIAENGNRHMTIYDMNQNEYHKLTQEKEIQKIELAEEIGYAELSNSIEYAYSYIKVIGADKNYLDTITLSEGRLPVNDKEIIIKRLNSNLNVKLGDTITLELGKIIPEEENIVDDLLEETPVTFEKQETKTYQVVGIIDNDINQLYSDYGIYFYTYQDSMKTDSITANILFKNVKDARKNIEEITDKLHLEDENVAINESLLNLYGSSRYSNLVSSLLNTMIIILVILSIGCAIVIYNSFAISVMERKKQFGLLSSIGATKKQIRKTVFFEAFVVGVIGIILGIIGAYIGIGVVLLIINKLLPGVFGNGCELKLVTYPLFIIVPIIFMIITILISAFIPAKSASKITPIQAIRLNDDIKIKGKKLKTPKIIRKLFGMEGEIALKNMKRNKKKYRITILSLFVSIVLFIVFSGYMKYALSGIDSYTELPNYDAILSYYLTSENRINEKDYLEEIAKNTDIKKLFQYHIYHLVTDTNLNKKEYYNDKFYELEQTSIARMDNVLLLQVNDKTYQNMLKAINKKEIKPIIYNHYKKITYANNKRKSYSINKYTSNLKESINLCETKYVSDDEIYKDCKYKLDNYYIADIDFFGNDLINDNNSLIVIVPYNYFGDLTDFNDGEETGNLFKLDDDKNLQSNLDELEQKYGISYNYNNLKENFKLTRNLIFCVKLLVYGFVVLVTLIGVTSVFNTINTSIHLRRKEFAMLRSVGLSSHGFNKILLFESLFFGLKSLIYSLPVSLGIIYLLYLSFMNMTDYDRILIPYKSILIAVIGVFIIILISTIYATRKIRHENILEAIREENI